MYERYCELRDMNHEKDSYVAKMTGIVPSTFSDWKKGKSIPNAEKLLKIAQHFNVSMEYLLTGKDAEKESVSGGKYYFNDETAEMAQAMYENTELRVLFDAARDAKPEDLNAVYDVLMALKRKEKNE